jgi:uncharacterized membrane protein YcaP (DUF421 family)
VALTLVVGALVILLLWARVWLGRPTRLAPHPARFHPLPVIADGKFLEANLARVAVTEADVLAQLRLRGIYDIAEIRRACRESDGQVRVVRYDTHHVYRRPVARRRQPAT